jgi:hypothetical protein
MSSAHDKPFDASSFDGAPLAKGILLRETLLERLDATESCAVWITAPAGYGKSCIAASFARFRSRPCLWLRLTPADADPASFFAHLSAATGASLPVPQAEQLADVAAFARYYFAALFATFRASGLLVLDEAEAVGEPLQAVLVEAVAALPLGSCLLITSRTAPPPALARARVEGRLQMIEADALAFTRDEIAALFAQRGVEASVTQIGSVHQCTLGWPAAVSLALLAGGRLPTVDDEVLRDYLHHEVWPAFDEATRQRLLLVAHLPYVNVALEQVWPDLLGAAAMLDRFAQRGLFVLTERGDDPHRVLHPLIRDFLCRHAQETLSTENLAELRSKASCALADAGQTEAAVPALLAAGEFDRAADAVLVLAPRLVAQARLRTLGGWLASFSTDWQQGRPELAYWLGQVWMMTKPARARTYLLHAEAAYAARGDTAGRLRTLAHLTYLSFVDFAPEYPITRWLGDLQQVAPRFDTLASAEEKAQLAMTVLYALLVGDPAHPELPRWRERALAALHAPIGLQLRARVASVLGINFLWSGLFEQLSAMHGALARPIAQQGLSDYGQLVWGLVELDVCWAQARLGDAPAVLQRLQKTAKRCGIHGLDVYHQLLASDALLAAGDLSGAEALIAQARASMLSQQLTEVWHAAFQAAWLAGWRDDLSTMKVQARAAIDAARAIRSPVCEALGWIAQALAHRRYGGAADVETTLVRLRELAPRSGSAMVDFHLYDLSAWLARQHDDAIAEALALRHALRLLARHDLVYPALGIDKLLAESAAAALAHGVETAFVQRWIRRRGLAMPAEVIAPDWPMPLQLQVLGGFGLFLDGALLTFSGKPQKRPLELLQALAFHGPAPVPVERLLDELWPELDGDAAHKSFEAALHRLRKLLGPLGSVLGGAQGGALRLEAGAVQLDTQRIGCDLWTLRALADLPPEWLQRRAGLAAWVRQRAAAPLLPLQTAPWASSARQAHWRRMQRRWGSAGSGAEIGR